MGRLTLALAVWFAACAVGQDARAIMRRAVEREMEDSGRLRNYTWFTDVTERSFDSSGKAQSTKSRTQETLILYGRQFRRVVARDGKPLGAAEEAREKARFEREVAKRAGRTEAERAKDDAEHAAREKKGREFLLQVPDLFDLKVVGEEVVRGRAAWVIEASPSKDARPTGSAAANICKLFGRLWIDQEEARWVKVEAEARSTLRFGLFLGSLGPGSKLAFEQVRLGDGAWLPLRVRAKVMARVVVKKFNLEEETQFRDYRRFSTDTRIVAEGEK